MIPSAARSPERSRQLVDAYLARRAAGERASPIPRRAPGPHPPLSFAQEQLWIHAQVAPDLPLYNEPMTVYRRGPLDVAALERSLTEILRRHEAWRTTVAVEHGEPVQVVRPPAPFPLPRVDLRHLPPAERESEALRLAGDDARSPFDLARGPLLRARLVHLADDDHRLYLTLHHIIFDGVAIHGIFLPELVALYAAFAAGQPSPLAEPAVQYGDFARWQRDSAADPAWATQLGYWKRRLADLPAQLSGPTDRPRPRVQTFQGALERFALPTSLSDALRTLSRSERVSLYMLLLAAFKALLHRYGRHDDVVVGSVTAGRKHPDLGGVLGYFVNPVVLRTDLGGDPPFREALARVRETTLDALSHDDVPFTRVVQTIAHGRDPSRNPLLQVVFSMEMPMPALDSGWGYRQTDVGTGLAKFDLDLQVEDRAEGIRGRVIYQTDLFEAATIRRLVRHYQTLLEGVATDPGRRLAALPLLTEDERHQALEVGNATGASYPADSTVHRVFEAQVERAPDAVAVVFDDRQLTYRELNRRANRLAHRLIRRGLRPGSVVGIYLERTPELVVAILASLKAGAVYLPLDPGYPRELLAFMLEDAGAAAVVTGASLAGALPAGGALRVDVDGDDAAGVSGPDDDLAVDVSAEDLAYLMYTSGSTGRPKGVAIPHRGVLRLVFGQDYARFGESRVHLQLAPVAFDASTFELWGALLHGARCVLFPGRVPTPRALAATIAEHGITTLWLTASLFNSLVDEAPACLVGIEELLIGGEALSVPHVRRAFAHLPSTRIINGYGPTESTTFTCCYAIPRELDPQASSIPLGRPIANTRVYVLDRHRNLVPIGVPGELYIGGDGLARGYHNHPELTAEKFLPDPFSGAPDDRLYRTGDRVRWRADGTLEFLGRLDEQLKIRGFRVEPGEVEAPLLRHPAVREAAVVARQDSGRGTSLVAWVVLHPGQTLEAAALPTFLQGKLAPHMVPAVFAALDALPLTPSGKVDRRALASREAGERGGRPAHVGPRDPLEAELVTIWEDLLGTSPIGATDDFFELGGHSLLALRLIQRIGERWGESLPLASLYSCPTVARLADRLRGSAMEAGGGAIDVLEPGGARAPLFFFHGDLHGGGFYCQRLARALGPEQPFYVVHPLGRDGKPMPPTIEAMAQNHLWALRAVRPRGPYRLGGYCNGGLVAFEVARLLERLGETVEVLILIAARPELRYARLRALGDRLVSMLGLPPALGADLFARTRAVLLSLDERPAREQAGLLVEKMRKLVGAGLDRVRRRPSRLLGGGTFDRYYRAVMGYLPGPYAGRIVLVWPADEPGDHGADPTMGWGRVAPAVDVHTLPGDHSTIVSRHTDAIAARLLRYV